MDPDRQEKALRMKRFEETLRQNGIKVTHQRMEIYREVADTGEHPDVETIYRRVRKKIPTISLDTVYRNLWLLDDMGLVTTLGLQRGRVRFDANVGPHHHFVCSECGSIEDFENSDFDNLTVPRAVSEMGDVESSHIQFRGICNRCRGNNTNKP